MTKSDLLINPKHKISLNWTAIVFFGSVHLLALLAPCFFSWFALGITLFLHWLFGYLSASVWLIMLSHRHNMLLPAGNNIIQPIHQMHYCCASV
jgi:sn-2 palmitoyl-lipid 9-desaturase